MEVIGTALTAFKGDLLAETGSWFNVLLPLVVLFAALGVATLGVVLFRRFWGAE